MILSFNNYIIKLTVRREASPPFSILSKDDKYKKSHIRWI
jgi:hypothetical protein